MNYLSKKEALLQYKNLDKIIFNDSLSNYFLIDNYHSFLNLLKHSKNPCFYEYINPSNNVKLFFDIEIHKSNFSKQDFFETPEHLINIIHDRLINYFPDYIFNRICLSSHNSVKKSFHLIYNILDVSGKTIYFKNYNSLKILYKDFKL